MDPFPKPNPEDLKLLFEQTKLAVEFYRDTTNQLITLSTGVLAFTVTFSKDVVKTLSKGKLNYLGAAWVFYLVSIAAGIMTNMALNGAVLDHTPHPVRVWVRIPSMIQFLAFMLGTILIVVYGILLARMMFVPNAPEGPTDGGRVTAPPGPGTTTVSNRGPTTPAIDKPADSTDSPTPIWYYWRNHMNSARAIDQAISQHFKELSKPGVLAVRPGYQATGGWVTRKPAIVVTVEHKRDDLAPEDRLPETLGGFPVDVRQASPILKLRATNPKLYALVAASARPEFERPVFPFERDATGQLLEATETLRAAARQPRKPQIAYVPPADAPLQAVQGNMTITCHASPDAGWPTLKAFLTQTDSVLTTGMYDFTSAHILETVESALNAKKFNLVLDHPALNPSRDQTDDETVSGLEGKFGDSMQFAWALEGMDRNAAAWIFPNAYHIKVAVRDGTTFWLSSGNWNNSNQPDIDPVADPSGSASIVRKSDRDWHVIVQNAKLAGLFEKYLLNDLKVARAHQTSAAGEPSDWAALGELASAGLAAASPLAPTQFFPPKTITASMKIQPLLTPDNYSDFILPLIKSARTSFYMQTQYIHPSNKDGDEILASLIQAVAQLINDGVDVRLIMSQFETQDWLGLVQDAGIDLSCVRIQHAVHNKGIVVDSKVVVVSSQNWSADGVARNRDAGLIIYNEEAAKYWQEIFIHDWTKLARQVAAE